MHSQDLSMENQLVYNEIREGKNAVMQSTHHKKHHQDGTKINFKQIITGKRE